MRARQRTSCSRKAWAPLVSWLWRLARAATSGRLARVAAAVRCTSPSSSTTYCTFFIRDRCALSRLATMRRARLGSSLAGSNALLRVCPPKAMLLASGASGPAAWRRLKTAGLLLPAAGGGGGTCWPKASCCGGGTDRLHLMLIAVGHGSVQRGSEDPNAPGVSHAAPAWLVVSGKNPPNTALSDADFR
ncbi:hypothetical protein V8C86DRAFT_2934843 [Haematococcus lacustris]